MGPSICDPTAKVYYVYFLIDPRNKMPFYVGKGKNDRALRHLKENIETTENALKHRRILKIRKSGLEPIVDVYIRELDEEEAYKLEEDYIAFYGRIGYERYGILTNICDSARPPKPKGFGSGPVNPMSKMENRKARSEGNLKMLQEGRHPFQLLEQNPSLKPENRKAASKRMKRRISEGYVPLGPEAREKAKDSATWIYEIEFSDGTKEIHNGRRSVMTRLGISSKQVYHVLIRKGRLQNIKITKLGKKKQLADKESRKDKD